MKAVKILVTGAKGFIGKNLIAELRNRNYKDIFEYDLDTEEELLDEYCREADFVFNLAGVNRPEKAEEFKEGNFDFVATLISTLRKHENDCPILLSSSVQAELDNPYGASKRAGEELLLNYGKEEGTEVFVYRLPNVFGKWCRPNYNSGVATFCHNIASGLPITVNDPKAILNLVYIDDVVNDFIGNLERVRENHKENSKEEGAGSKSKSTKKESIENESIENESIENESIENESIKSESIESESIESESIESESIKSESIESESIENESIEKESGLENRYCKISTVYTKALGDIVDLLYSFKRSREDLSIPKMSDGFTKKLYSTYLSYLPRNEFAYPLKMNKDERGSFTEFIRTEDRGQVSVNISKAGITKGNHWHHTKNEKFLVVSGQGVIRFRGIDGGKVIEYFVDGEHLQVVDIPPGYTHNIENLGESDMVTIMWVNEIFDKNKADTYYLEV